jgi:hypothetical protein
MATVTRLPAFPGYRALSPVILVSNDSACMDIGYESQASQNDPTTVIIYGWGDGQPKHVAKYADGYRTLYPQAKIIMVLAPILGTIYQSVERRTESMGPVIDEVFPTPYENNERVLIHVMSNTGVVAFASTLNCYRARYGETMQLPYTFLVFDSTPGGTDFADNAVRWSRAMTVGTKAWFPWPVAMTQAMWFMFLCATNAPEYLAGKETLAAFSRRAMNDMGLCSRDGSRLYLYSKEDDLIGWEDIEDHATIARSKGYKTMTELFVGSAHVAHMRDHPEQYWQAIQRGWSSLFRYEAAEEKPRTKATQMFQSNL